MSVHWRQKQRRHVDNHRNQPQHGMNGLINQQYQDGAVLSHNIKSNGFRSSNRYEYKQNEVDYEKYHRSNRYNRYKHYRANTQNADKSNHRNYQQQRRRNAVPTETNGGYRYNRGGYHQQNAYNHYNHHNEAEKRRPIKQDPKYKKPPSPEIQPVLQNNLKYLKEKEFWIREKSDGMNVLCYITQNSVYFVDKKFNVRMLTDSFYGSHGFIARNKVLLFSGELIVSQRNQQHNKNKYIFFKISDCIAYDGVSIANRTASVRQQYVDKFMRFYNDKLINYAIQQNKFKKKVIMKMNDDQKEKESIKKNKKESYYKPGDELDTATSRLLKISTQIDNMYQHTKSLKNKIIALCKSPESPLTKKQNMVKKKKNGNPGINILEKIELDVVSILFTAKHRYKANRENLEKLSRCILYENDLNDDGYFYTDPITGFKTKNDGLEFIPEHNGYMMQNDESGIEVQRAWKPKELLTVNVKVIRVSKPSYNYGNNRDKEMDSFIDFDKLHLYIYNESKTGSKDLWFNSIDMGQNEINQKKRPFWNKWHVKQRSNLNHFISSYKEKRNESFVDSFIVECNYDFQQKSWSLYKLKLNENKACNVQKSQDIISRMEECIEMKDLVQTLSD